MCQSGQNALVWHELCNELCNENILSNGEQIADFVESPRMARRPDGRDAEMLSEHRTRHSGVVSWHHESHRMACRLGARLCV